MRSKGAGAASTIRVESRVEGDILRVIVQGQYSTHDGDRLLEQVREQVVQFGVRRVICDLRRAAAVVRPLRLNQRMRRITTDEALAAVKTALIVNVRSNNFAYLEELATHNALPVRVFTDGAEAEQWLNEPDARLAAAS